MIYDCFSYWDEDLLLDLRLNIMNNYVDYFVIVEGDKNIFEPCISCKVPL